MGWLIQQSAIRIKFLSTLPNSVKDVKVSDTTEADSNIKAGNKIEIPNKIMQSSAFCKKNYRVSPVH
jgi:hypothetical protein